MQSSGKISVAWACSCPQSLGCTHACKGMLLTHFIRLLIFGRKPLLQSKKKKKLICTMGLRGSNMKRDQWANRCKTIDGFGMKIDHSGDLKKPSSFMYASWRCYPQHPLRKGHSTAISVEKCSNKCLSILKLDVGGGCLVFLFCFVFIDFFFFLLRETSC